MPTIDELLAQELAIQAQGQVAEEVDLDQLLQQELAQQTVQQEEQGMPNYERVFSQGAGQNARTFGASAGKEVLRIKDNILDMAGIIEPEEAQKRDYDRQLAFKASSAVDPDSGWATGGDIAAKVTAGIPIALATRGAGMSALLGSGRIAGATAAALEGGLVGATQGEVGNRGVDSAQAAGINTILDSSLRALSRGTIRGIGNQSESAKSLTDQIKFKNKKDTFIPVLQNVDEASAGIGDNLARISQNVAGVFPKAKATMQRQADDFAQDTNELMIRQTIPGADRGATGAKVLEETGSMGRAIDASRGTLKAGTATPLSPNQVPIINAARKADDGNFSPEQLASASRQAKIKADEAAGVVEVSGAPMEKMARDLLKTRGQSLGTTDLATREGFHKFMKASTDMLGNVARVIPGASAVASAIASKGFQNFLMGNAGLQKTIQEVMKKGDETQILRVWESAVAAFSADVSNTVGNERSILSQAKEAASELSNRAGAAKDVANPFN